jgi:hypothetical protein
MTEDELVQVLADMAARVKVGDSFEGSIEYLMPYDNFDIDAIEFERLPAEKQALYEVNPATAPRYTPKPHAVAVQASYRIGNTDGQGGVRMIGEWKEVEE